MNAAVSPVVWGDQPVGPDQALAPLRPLPPPTQFEAYARAVAQQPFLSETEEAELVGRWRDGGDRAAAWRLVVSHLRLVVRAVRDHQGYGMPPGDLAQEGTVGLMKAVRRFDPEHGVRLAAYAVRWIEAEIREFIFRNWRLVRLSGSSALRKLFFGYRKTVAALRGWGEERSPVDPEVVAQVLAVPAAEVRAAEGYFRGQDEGLYRPDSGDPDHENSEERSLALPEGWAGSDDPAESELARDSHAAMRAAVRHALADLPERDRAIVVARRLKEPSEGLQELGRVWGVSAERVRQIENRAWDRLRRSLASSRGLLTA